MKRIISVTLVCVLLAFTLLTLVSCGKILTGTYEAETILGDITYEFALGGKVTKTFDPLVGSNETAEGTYEFNKEGDELTITFGEKSTTYTFSSGEEDGVKYIKLDGLKYTIVK